MREHNLYIVDHMGLLYSPEQAKVITDIGMEILRRFRITFDAYGGIGNYFLLSKRMILDKPKLFKLDEYVR